MLIQFGHNDGGNIDQPKYRGSLKGMGDETQTVQFKDDSTEVVHTYGWYMKNILTKPKPKELHLLCLVIFRGING